MVNEKFSAIGRYQLPPNSRLNLAPGVGFKTPPFFCPQRPWIKFYALIYPKSAATRNYVELQVKLLNPKMLNDMEISAKIRMTLEGRTKDENFQLPKVPTKRITFSKDEDHCVWDRLFRRDFLFSNFSKVLRRGRFILQLHISFSFKTPELAFEPSIHGEPDCVIVSNKYVVKVHSKLLKEHSKMVEVLISNQEHPVLNYDNFEPCVIHSALMFVYSGTIASEVPVDDLHRFAQSCGFEILKTQLESRYCLFS